jgi:hypothetical protein
VSRRTARGNRIGMIVVGLVLFAAGGAALTRGLAIRPALLGPAHAAVIDEQTRRYATSQSWFWPALAATAVVAALLALRWLAVQTRSDAIRHIGLEPDPRHGVTRLSAGAATGALEDDLSASPYVQRVNATATGAPTTPRLALTVTLHTNANPADATHRINQALARFRHALETERLTATVRIRTTGRR